MNALDDALQTPPAAKEGTYARFYFILRNLHLYVGLFLSPFVLLFAVSAFLLNHPGIPLGAPVECQTKVMQVDVPRGFDKLEGMERMQQARQILRQASVSGEIGPVHYSDKDGRLIIPVSKPGYETTVDVTLRTGLASITERGTGFLDSFIYLHKMPGPHLANIRGNWWVVRAWTWFADGTAWLLIFLSVSGAYLWAVLRSERHIGLMLLAGGVISFLGALYAICS